MHCVAQRRRHSDNLCVCRAWAILWNIVRVSFTSVEDGSPAGSDSLQGERRGKEGQQSQEVANRPVEGDGRGYVRRPGAFLFSS